MNSVQKSTSLARSSASAPRPLPRRSDSRARALATVAGKVPSCTTSSPLRGGGAACPTRPPIGGHSAPDEPGSSMAETSIPTASAPSAEDPNSVAWESPPSPLFRFRWPSGVPLIVPCSLSTGPLSVGTTDVCSALRRPYAEGVQTTIRHLLGQLCYGASRKENR